MVARISATHILSARMLTLVTSRASGRTGSTGGDDSPTSSSQISLDLDGCLIPLEEYHPPLMQ